MEEKNKKKEEQKTGKLTYEQLNNAANQLFVQNKQLAEANIELRKKVNEYQTNEYYQRLDWLWKVIDCNNYVVNDAFKAKCMKEFETLMNVDEDSMKDAPKETASEEEDSKDEQD